MKFDEADPEEWLTMAIIWMAHYRLSDDDENEILDEIEEALKK